MADRRPGLSKIAHDVEDAASGLHRFRDNLPRAATGITAIVGELFAVSSALLQIHTLTNSRHVDPSIVVRVDHDLAFLFRTLKASVQAIFGMFARASELPYQLVWDDLNDRMLHDEGLGLLPRVELYRDFLANLLQVLERRRRDCPRELRVRVMQLWNAQEAAMRRNQRQSFDSSASTPRPYPSTPLARLPAAPFIQTSVPSSGFSDDRDDINLGPPVAPEPPPPMSPTFTSSSSETMFSSHTSYSSDPQPIPVPPIAHWSQDVFDGRHPCTEYRADCQSPHRSSCYGSIDVLSLQHLQRDGFQETLQLPFDEGRLIARLFWRSVDFRARILIMTKDARGQDVHFCQPLTNLRLFRRGSTLQLCRARQGDGGYDLWARLNFLFHERMVLFYSTFVAMKRQDMRDIAHAYLVDVMVLDENDEGEERLFGGQIQHDNMLHALRLFRDRRSGVVRLEASALRGPKKDVPIWTAFVTRYAAKNDLHWAAFEGRGVVSLAALRPAPTVFIAGYKPPKNPAGDYMLPFTTKEDASMFIERWSAICQSYGRRS